MRKLILVVAVLLVALPRLALAEPDDNIKTLMETPVTLFSQGLVNMEKSLKSVANSMQQVFATRFEKPPNVSVRFQWEENRIDAFIYTYFKGDRTPPVKETCAATIEAMRGEFGVNNGKLVFSATLESRFRPKGYTNKTIDSALKNIHKLVKLKSNLIKNNKVVMECEGPLVSNKIFYSK
jgi:hypothetical protein